MSRARVVGWGVDVVGVNPEDLLDLAGSNVELVAPAQRAGIELPDHYADAEERWTKEVEAYQAGDLGARFTLFAVLEEDGVTERFEFGVVGSVWARTEERSKPKPMRRHGPTPRC